MKKEEVVIFVNACKKYECIIETFMDLMRKNWNDCPYKFFLLTDQKLSNYNDAYIFENDSLPTKIYKMSKIIDANYYICLLGDAFIYDFVDNNLIESFIVKLKNANIEYCNLIPKKYKKCIFERIKISTGYGMSFIAFAAKKEFIEREFKDNITDYDFENNHLLKSINAKRNDYYDNRYILNENIFKITHAVSKGKWINDAYKKVYKQVELPINIPKMNFRDVLYINLSKLSRLLFPNRIRIKIKKLLSIFGLKFSSKY